MSTHFCKFLLFFSIFFFFFQILTFFDIFFIVFSILFSSLYHFMVKQTKMKYAAALSRNQIPRGIRQVSSLALCPCKHDTRLIALGNKRPA